MRVRVLRLYTKTHIYLLRIFSAYLLFATIYIFCNTYSVACNTQKQTCTNFLFFEAAGIFTDFCLRSSSLVATLNSLIFFK
jgi:hypothetical protein